MQNEDTDRYWILMDMDVFEEESCEETGCITLDCSNEADSILRIEKSGGSVIDVAHLEQINGFAKRRWQQWRDVLQTSSLP
jgi:exosome complex RNA-binding protein Rrp42 (RNase PH superfamily)